MNLHDLILWDQSATLSVNGSDSLFLDNLVSTVTRTPSWTLLLLALLYIIFRNNSWKEAALIVLTIGLMIFAMDRICSGWVKPTVARWRPTQDPNLMYLVDVVNNYRGGRFGFFSGHASNTFCVATFLALLFRSGKFGCLLFFWSSTTTFTRIYLGVHYLGDVIVGAVSGMLVGTIFYLAYFYLVHRRMTTARLISEQFTSTGYLKHDLVIFSCVIFLNYLLLILISLSHSF
jgi:undecaprenyl-diphosphatase